MKGGVDIGYALPTRVPDALAAVRIPSDMLITDGGNAYNSIFQDKVIEELIEAQPSLVGFWST